MSPIIWVGVAIFTIIALVLSWFLLAIIAKILWGWWPLLLTLPVAGWVAWQYGLEWAWTAGLLLFIGFFVAWKWQSTLFFLRGDRAIERILGLED